MKVQMTAESKRIVTVSEMPVVRRIIESLKEDTNINEVVEMAVNAVASSRNKPGEYCGKVLEAKASIAKNCRVWNFHENDSEQLDVWIEAMVVLGGSTITSAGGFMMIGFYLSDAWQVGSDEMNEELARHSFIRRFVEQK